MTSTSTTPGAQLRPATAADLPAVERLLIANNLPTAGVADALHDFLVAESEEEIVGVGGLEVCCDNALLRSVAVDERWRGRGLGRAVVSGLIADAEARGLNALYLLTTTAERYFPSFGFAPTTREAVPAPVKETVEFRSACPASATVMALPLRADAARDAARDAG
ncbi:MAG TPA: arsenic resistance N-acetyltransferase ArsN2 [Gemmatimonadaceae bacterium]|nr:arsenic resistance N-acetyltransferase ArsN2 [Gemmatimonadaceae bacterium]